MKLSKRLERVEQRIRIDNYLPVLLVDSEDEIEQHSHRIGRDTVIIIDDIGSECVESH